MPTNQDSPVTKAELKTELGALEERVLERMEKVETNLLRAFRNWATTAETKLKVNDILVRSFDERLNAVEERMSELERRTTK